MIDSDYGEPVKFKILKLLKNLIKFSRYGYVESKVVHLGNVRSRASHIFADGTCSNFRKVERHVNA